MNFIIRELYLNKVVSLLQGLTYTREMPTQLHHFLSSQCLLTVAADTSQCAIPSERWNACSPCASPTDAGEEEKLQHRER